MIKKARVTKDELLSYFKSILNHTLVTVVFDLDPKKSTQVVTTSSWIVNSGLPLNSFGKKDPIRNNSLKSSTSRYSSYQVLIVQKIINLNWDHVIALMI